MPAQLPTLPSPPGALSAAQIGAVARTVSAQRKQIAALVEQLQAFDQQLAVLEKILEPLRDWSATWADLERSVTRLLRPGRSGDER